MDNCITWGISLGILFIQAIIAALSYFKIYRYRVIYGIKRHRVVMPTGLGVDAYMPKVDEQIEQINNDLLSGKHTVYSSVPCHLRL